MNDTDETIKRFIRLSEALTGFHPLSSTLAQTYLARLRSEPFGQCIEALLRAFDAMSAPEREIPDTIFANDNLRPLAEQIILVWYTSAFCTDGTNWRFGQPDEYFQALMWTGIHAHPPALSGGYFGYWKYPPEN